MIKFIGSFDTAESLPKAGIREYAFVGRSNVGKSSLLNALVGQRIARTSNTPGRTQTINLFEWSECACPPHRGGLSGEAGLGGASSSKIIKSENNNLNLKTPPLGCFAATPPLKGGDATECANKKIILADLPGYGYARASKEELDKWAARLEKYLLHRAQLERLFILVDSRHGLKESDRDMMNFCDAHAIRYQIILTKLDKIPKSEIKNRESETEAEVAKRGAACARVISTSAEKKIGIEELKNEIIKPI